MINLGSAITLYDSTLIESEVRLAGSNGQGNWLSGDSLSESTIIAWWYHVPASKSGDAGFGSAVSISGLIWVGFLFHESVLRCIGKCIVHPSTLTAIVSIAS